MREIVGDERDALLLDVLKRIWGAKPHADSKAWDDGWKQALDLFLADPREENLVPAFIKPGQPVRMNGAFWADVSELNYVRECQEWLARQFVGCHVVYEFGCGTGFNLVALAKYMPSMFFGRDLSAHAVALTNEAGRQLKLPIEATQFDMRSPGGTLAKDAGVFTFGAMEQVGTFAPFIDWLVQQHPKVAVHIEPIPELLSENNLLDWMSLRFHERRGYTVGLLPYLLQHPAIAVTQVERSNFGSLMLESYARIVWRPK